MVVEVTVIVVSLRVVDVTLCTRVWVEATGTVLICGGNIFLVNVKFNNLLTPR